MARFLVPGEQTLRRPRRVTETQPRNQFQEVPRTGRSTTESEVGSQKESAEANRIEGRPQLQGHPRTRIHHICVSRGSTEQN